MTAKENLIDYLEIRVEALEKEIKELNRDLNLHCSTLESMIKGLEAELKLEGQKRESLEWHYKLESDELKAELKLENENKRSQHVNLCLQIEDLEKDCKELADVIRGLDPTNPILQHLAI